MTEARPAGDSTRSLRRDKHVVALLGNPNTGKTTLFNALSGLRHTAQQTVKLVRTLPDGVNLTAIKQTGAAIEIKGAAESNTRVSAFMRNTSQAVAT